MKNTTISVISQIFTKILIEQNKPGKSFVGLGFGLAMDQKDTAGALLLLQISLTIKGGGFINCFLVPSITLIKFLCMHEFSKYKLSKFR